MVHYIPYSLRARSLSLLLTFFLNVHVPHIHSRDLENFSPLFCPHHARGAAAAVAARLSFSQCQCCGIERIYSQVENRFSRKPYIPYARVYNIDAGIDESHCFYGSARERDGKCRRWIINFTTGGDRGVRARAPLLDASRGPSALFESATRV